MCWCIKRQENSWTSDSSTADDVEDKWDLSSEIQNAEEFERHLAKVRGRVFVDLLAQSS
jgi:hypothetical protein